VPHVASGELPRPAIEAGTPPGTPARGFMNRRELVPVDLVLQAVLDRLGQPDAERGFILDWLPLRRRQLRRSTPLPTAIDAVGNARPNEAAS
jgi:adenylate kinase